MNSWWPTYFSWLPYCTSLWCSVPSLLTLGYYPCSFPAGKAPHAPHRTCAQSFTPALLLSSSSTSTLFPICWDLISHQPPNVHSSLPTLKTSPFIPILTTLTDLSHFSTPLWNTKSYCVSNFKVPTAPQKRLPNLSFHPRLPHQQNLI